MHIYIYIYIYIYVRIAMPREAAVLGLRSGELRAHLPFPSLPFPLLSLPFNLLPPPLVFSLIAIARVSWFCRAASVSNAPEGNGIGAKGS